jgi:hypothetical protein
VWGWRGGGVIREELLMDEVELPEEQVQQKRALFKQVLRAI